jgi:phage-related protein
MADVESLELQLTGDASKAKQSIDTLIDSLKELEKATAGGCGLSAVTKELGKMKNVNIGLSSSTKSSGASFGKLAAKVTTAWIALRKTSQTIASLITESNEYVENLNLFSVAMGEYAGEAQNYAEEVGELLGIDPSTWMRNQGVFMTLATGFGVAGDRAATMSQQLTQLGYDLSSFFNISVEEAMQKLKSGFAGELEPLRNLGYDLSQAKLEAIALSLGIDKSVSSMTQAEKAQLRYYAIMTQVTTAQGDMARTLDAPANQLRILRAQVDQAARALGNIFIPMLNAVLPHVIAVVKVVRLLANAIANLVGFTMPDVDYSGLGSAGSGAEQLSEGLDEASGKAAKLNKTLLGIDELNVMSDPSSGSGGGSDIGGGGFDFDLPTYDFIGEATNNRINEIVDKMKEWLGITGEIDSWSDLLSTKLGNVLVTVGLIGLGFASWKIATVIPDIGKLFKDTGKLTSLAGTAKIASSVFLTLAGGITVLVSAIDALNNGVDWKNLLGMLGGMGLIVGGLAISFGATGAAIGLLVGGLALFVTGVVDAVNGSKSLETALAIITGILAIGGAIAILIGGWIPLAVAAVVAAVAMVVMYWDEIVVWFKDTCAAIGQFFSNLWNGIVSVWNTVATWFNTNVIQPVVGFFSGLWTSVSGFFVNLWTDIVAIFTAIPGWFDTNVIQPVVNFFVGLWNGISNAASNCWNAIVTFFSPAISWFSQLFASIWQTISDVFYNIGVIASGCWQIIQAVWGIVSAWFDTNVIQPVVNFFVQLWSTVSTTAINAWNGIKNVAIAAWNGIKTVFSTIGSWINQYIIQPVSAFFTNLWNGIRTAAINAWDGIKSVYATVTTWISTNIIQPVGTFFSNLWNGFISGAKVAWEGVKSVFSTVASFFQTTFQNAWAGVVKIFSIAGDIFVNIKDGIVSVFKTVVNGLITGINKVVSVPFNAINNALTTIRNIKIVGLQPFANLRTISVPSIPLLAGGGVVDSGQMFVANEAGPELVGNVGRKTAVMNNDQIIESVSRGVYEAVVAAMGDYNGGQSGQEINLYLDGKQITATVEKHQKSRGATLMTGGMAYGY